MDPARIIVIIVVECNEQGHMPEQKWKIERNLEYGTYLWSEFLTVFPSPREENVAVVVHGVSGSNNTIHMEW